jgi:hypothetical protein
MHRLADRPQTEATGVRRGEDGGAAADLDFMQVSRVATSATAPYKLYPNAETP